MDDRPPDVHILRPGNDEGVTPLQEVPIEARADDDFGIQKMDWCIRRRRPGNWSCRSRRRRAPNWRASAPA